MSTIWRAAGWFCLALLALLSLLPAGGIEPVREGYYSFALPAEHIVAYGGTMAVLAAAWGSRLGLSRLGLGLVAYGALLEASQLLVPGRTAQLVDAFENVAGVAAGLVFVLALAAVRHPFAKPAAAD